jgi:asparagine synthase (glutamine-hydrolysing)
VYRYVVLIWNPANDAAASTADDLINRLAGRATWSRVLQERGLAVLHSGAHATEGSCRTEILPERRGAICGRLFERGSELRSQHSAAVAPENSADLVRSGGRALLDRYWGRYVAVLHDAAAGEVHILRDPTGSLPCFQTRVADVCLVFSDLQDILALDVVRFSVNWKYIAAFVPYSALQIRDTGLNEVTEVQQGERLTFRAERIERQMLWNPLDAVRQGLIENADEAVNRIGETVRNCVHAWASLHRSIVHTLSGGLDSSIVLSCLADAPNRPSLACLHFFAPFSREDERQHARLAARHFDAELIECALDPRALHLERVLKIRPAPRPWFYIYDLEQGPHEVQLAASRAATGIFSGASGDGLFLQARAELSVADYLRRHGLSRGVFQVALNAARITRTSMWPILRNGFRQHMKRPVRDAFGGMEQLVTLVPAEVRAAARADDSIIHPWLADIGSIPPGLRWHIMTLSVPPAFYSSIDNGRELERTAPLFSQPLIELCLRIPSYVWISGGRDRSLVRKAFAARLPDAIVRRTQKGASDRHNRKLMDENAVFLREMLLEGLLVERGLLDRARLEDMLSRGKAPLGFEYNEVLRQHLCTEVWLRQWVRTTSSSAR